ncbi:unnamed protein product [Sphacelaria rigidula]
MASGLTSLVGGYGSESGSDSDDSTEKKSHTEKTETTPKEGGAGQVEVGKGNGETGKKETMTAAVADTAEESLEEDASANSREQQKSKDNEGEDESSEEESSEEEEGEDEGQTGTATAGSRKQTSTGVLALPSVDDLFSSTAGPDFLSAPSAGQEFVVKAMKKKTKSKPSPMSSSNADRSITASEKRGRDIGVGVGVGTGLPADIKKPRGGGVGPTGPPPEKGKKGAAGDKISAKEKVKGQRLKGQSGIGSDFRVWKSDLEMTMRQQYD